MTIFDVPIRTLSGDPSSLAEQLGKALLLVNVASKCGLTPQYEGLERIHERYAGRGFAVLGFPCNQFGRQEPGDAKQIADFCESKYDVTFPMFAKIDVNGFAAHPLYNYLRKQKSGLLGSSIRWNFTKFLIDREGRVVARHAPTTAPNGLKKEIEALL